MKHTVIIPKSNIYIQSLFGIFKQFVLEESIGNAFTEERLTNKIRMAKALYKAERKELCKTNDYYGVLDSSNAEIMLV